ncbi:ComEA family DNA-binding protein [Pontibacillus litoralis]|uniref:Competence protein ComEA n=1 Tax=Pontibacillus litoralis JSM 072002 TaxID=1385512 RepID=A0A0A5GCM2_9BACI|nr:ComEA family DNA-binding protein [Pontibacillus litoralis]KGX88938.1 competence protein ComEA [Pontibacillus litoralis JSM 072002]
MNRIIRSVIMITGIVGIMLFLVFSKTGSKEANSSNPVVVPSEETTEASEQLEETPSEEEIYVYIDVKGEVKQPGVYKMTNGKRVQDVIEQAGGLASNADPHSINLAQKLVDEMVVTVLPIGEAGASGAMPNGESNSKIKVNQAAVEELQKLPGIGESKANAIVQYREENGPFQAISDLQNVKGIGEKTVEGFESEVQVP